VTYNLKDFPRTSLAPYNIEAQHPDEFLMHLYGIDPITMAQLVVDQAADLKKRLMTGMVQIRVDSSGAIGAAATREFPIRLARTVNIFPGAK